MTPSIKKIVAPLMVLTLAFGAVASTYEPAAAGHRGGRFAAGLAAGIIGLGVLGAVANANGHRRYYRDVESCYEGPEHCGYTKDRCHYNSWGDYVCRRGEWRCWRETVCD